MQIIVGGLIFGCIYALAALGIVLIYKTTDVVNFAHGEMAMFTTFISFVLLTQYGFNYFTSLLLALVFAICFGSLVYLIFMRKVQNAPHINQVVLTLGLFMIINGVASFLWGNHPASFPEAVEGDVIQIGNVYVTPHDLFMVGITLLLMFVFFLIFKFSKIGLAMRSSSQDMLASKLMGINITLVFLVTWGIGAALGGIAGIMTAPFTFLSPNMMGEILIIAFAGAVLGGFISLPGAVLGGLIIGIVENLISYYISPELRIVIIFLFIILVLYIRPQGILGGAKLVKKV